MARTPAHRDAEHGVHDRAEPSVDDRAGHGVDRPAVSYPLINSNEREAARLEHLQSVGDPVTVRWLERLGVAAGWRCLELGAGAGSIARWLSEVVGATGMVTAVDQDVTQLRTLETRTNVTVVEGDLCTLEFPRRTFDLVHSRAVLMHLACPDRVVAEAVEALAPGGQVFFEETGGAPALAVADPPEPYALVMAPMARRWTWAAGLAELLQSLGLEEVSDQVRQDPLVGATPLAAFWRHTLTTVVNHLSPEAAALVPAMCALLDDPGFRIPFSERHRVTARRPR